MVPTRAWCRPWRGSAIMSPPRAALEFVNEETAMQVQPYLFFDGRCDEALQFYKKAIGAKVDMLMRFKDAPAQSMSSPGSHDKVMHAAVHIGETQVLMSDGRCLGKPNFQGFALTISAPDAAAGGRRFM